ncbi:MAG: hypothetical protein SFY80_15755 [Verrucomicrobiota bacterium]|nr:hypothetical protein [Verrucomicrobiota bacterium]
MAKKPTPITFRDIILGAEADTIRRALEARLQIDLLIKERQAAYERIAELETQVEDVLGEAGSFPFPLPPLPVAGLDPKMDFMSRASAPVAKKAGPAGRPVSTSANAATDSTTTPAPAATTADSDDDASDEDDTDEATKA